MKRKIAWMCFSKNIRSGRKLSSLEARFEEKMEELDFEEESAKEAEGKILAAKALGANVITYIDNEYPACLKNIFDPPPYIYVKGDPGLLEYPVKVAMVGSREATLYGKSVAHDFAYLLSSNKVVIVSGGAKGIDTAALKGAMQAGSPVICVIGTGIDISYPKENAALFEKIYETGGAVVTEFDIGVGPMPGNFPMRNRIMTALSDSVTVIEAALKSGAMISASYALEQGKTLFSVPGNITSPKSAGTNALLQDGARWALSGDDILFDMMEEIPEKFRALKTYSPAKADISDSTAEEETKKPPEKNETAALSALERAVINAINSGNSTYEKMLTELACEPRKLTAALTIMEMKGIIKLVRGNLYEIEAY